MSLIDRLRTHTGDARANERDAADEIDNLTEELANLTAGYSKYVDIASKGAELAQAEIDRLQAIVDKLPKTADGVTMVPGMRVWTFATADGPVYEVEIGYLRLGGTYSHVYSTREAAVAAKEP